MSVLFFVHVSAIRYILIILVAISLAPGLGQAAAITSLEQCLEVGLENNRSLAVAVNRAAQAEAAVDQATGRLLPRIDLSAGVQRSNSPLGSFAARLQQKRVTAQDFNPALLNEPGYINNYQSRLSLNMPIYAGGALWAGRAQAKHHAEASALQVDFERQRLIYQIIAAYIDVLQSKARIAAQQKAVHAAEQYWRDVQSMQKRGMAIASDVMDAHVHLLRSQVALQRARSAHADSIDALRLILGANEKLTLGDLQDPRLRIDVLDLESLLQQGAAQRADLRALKKELQAAEAAVRQARAAYLPQVNLMAMEEWNDNRLGLRNANTTIGASVSLNLFAGGADRARLRAAEAERAALELRIEDKQQQIANEIRSAWRRLQTATQRYQSEIKASRQIAESLRVKTLRHARGLEKTTDLLAAQARMDASRVALIRARYDVMLAKAALLLASGALTKEAVQ